MGEALLENIKVQFLWIDRKWYLMIDREGYKVIRFASTITYLIFEENGSTVEDKEMEIVKIVRWV